MGFFSFLFGGGKYPTTAKYEAQLAQQQADYEKFLKIASSAELKRYEELKELTSKSDFKNRVNKLKTEKFSSTEEYRKEQELKKLRGSSDVKAYYKFKQNKEQEFNQALNSAAYKECQALQGVVKSAAFMQKAKVKNSEEAQTLQKYKQLTKDRSVRLVEKTIGSSEYKSYKKIDGSETLKKIESLEEYVKTEAFIAKKADLENKNRFKESEENKSLMELSALEKDKDLKWYAEKASKNAYADYAKWAITFEEQFAGTKLSDKWMLGYYTGVKYTNKVYSLADERQKFDMKSAVVAGGVLDIQTRASKTVGEVWDPSRGGFVKSELECTSALVNTGDGFRQKYGRFVFKVRVTGATRPVSHNIWLSAERNNEINVASFTTVGKKGVKTMTVGSVVAGTKKTADITDLKFDDEYYIYALDWTAEKLTWSVNGVEVFTTKQGVPQEEMYIGISTNVIGEGEIPSADLNVEWIKVYSQK